MIVSTANGAASTTSGRNEIEALGAAQAVGPPDGDAPLASAGENGVPVLAEIVVRSRDEPSPSKAEAAHGAAPKSCAKERNTANVAERITGST
jgi:hypothetical protein